MDISRLLHAAVQTGASNLHLRSGTYPTIRVDGQLQRLTRDHTVVQQEVDAGRLTPELARTVPHKNILTKSVGYHGPVDPDATTRGVQHGDVFVLCSDGLTDPLPDSDIQTLCAEKHPEDLAQALLDAALTGGTEDNVTVVVVVASDD